MKEKKKTREIAQSFIFLNSGLLLKKILKVKMADDYQYNTFSIDEHFNEDEPQSKLTDDIRFEEETYFEK